MNPNSAAHRIYAYLRNVLEKKVRNANLENRQHVTIEQNVSQSAREGIGLRHSERCFVTKSLKRLAISRLSVG
jgi:hypothetical protein